MPIQCFGVARTGNSKIENAKDEWCEQCKETHHSEDKFIEWQRLDTGETFWNKGYWDMPVGAMWFQEMWDIHTDTNNVETARYKGNGNWDNDDGFHLFVAVPTRYRRSDGSLLEGVHHWDVDSRASNCQSLGDRTHRCWVRHGVIPNITVNKAGPTCAAGAGSIQVEGWHGFLTNGVLHEC